MSRVAVRVKESSAQLEKSFLEAFRTRLNGVLHRATGPIRIRIGGLCDSLIRGTETYESLTGGELLGELGIPDVEASLSAILAVVRDHVEVEAIPARIVGPRVLGGLTIGILRSGYEDLLSLPEASYVSAPSGEEIRWLDWLLLQGDRIVVVGYDAFFDLSAAERQRSRTGMALMRRGKGWHVDPDHSGTEFSNFLTKSFIPGAERAIAEIVRQEIERRI